jgi:hypothetical protein
MPLNWAAPTPISDLPELLRRTRPAALVTHRYTKSLRSRLRAEQTSAISQLVLDTATRLYIERGYAGDAVSEKGLPCPASVEVRLSLQALEGSPIDFWELQPPSGEVAEGGAPHGLGHPPESRELFPWWWRVNTVLTKTEAAPDFSSQPLIWIICSFESSSSW